MTGYDDVSLWQAETALIQQLNNLSHHLQKPAAAIFSMVLDATDEELDTFFHGEEGVQEVADGTVRALIAIHGNRTIAWAFISQHEELADYDPNAD